MPIGTSNASTTRRTPRPRPDPGDGGGGEDCSLSFEVWCSSAGGYLMSSGGVQTCLEPDPNFTDGTMREMADPCPNRGQPPPGGDGDGDGKDAPDDVDDPNDARCGPNATWDYNTQSCVPTPTTRDPYDRSPDPAASNIGNDRTHGNPSRPTIPPVTGAPTTQGTTAEQQIPWWSFTEGGPQQPGVEQQPQVGGGQQTFGGQSWAEQAQQALINSPQMWRWS